MAGRIVLCCLLALCAVPAGAQRPGPGTILPLAPPGWEVVEEAVADPSGDPDLVRWGVRAQHTRHYTRRTAIGVQVCSVEVWTFRDAARARSAHQGFAYPGWRIDRRGPRLVMLRGLTRPRRGPARRGIFPDCGRLGDRVLERAAAAL